MPHTSNSLGETAKGNEPEDSMVCDRVYAIETHNFQKTAHNCMLARSLWCLAFHPGILGGVDWTGDFCLAQHQAYFPDSTVNSGRQNYQLPGGAAIGRSLLSRTSCCAYSTQLSTRGRLKVRRQSSASSCV